jgi:predicted dehydrogenase
MADGGIQVTRRGFIRTAAGVTAGMGARPGYVAEGGTLKVGLVGCGARGTGAARQALEAGRQTGAPIELVALADAFQDCVDVAFASFTMGNRPGVKLTKEKCFAGLDAYKKLLETDVNYVILATPPGFRPIHFEAAVAAGKHIFMEKPVGTDAAGIQKIMTAANEAGTKKLSVVAGTQRRHDPPYIQTIQKIHDGAIGKVLSARAYWCGGPVFKAVTRKPEWSDLEWQMRAWYSFAWCGGDNIVEQHIHNIDVMDWVMGAHPVEAFAVGGRAWKTDEPFMGNIWDNFGVDFIYPGGIHVMSLSRHWNAPGIIGEWVVGAEKESNCHDLAEKSPIAPQVQEHIDLINSITGQGKYVNEGAQAAQSSFTAILGREAAYTGQRLKWEDLLKSNFSLLPELSFETKIPTPEVPVPGKGISVFPRQPRRQKQAQKVKA